MAKRPNILFLMTDQQRWDALGCANPIVKTPNLDQLAAQPWHLTALVSDRADYGRDDWPADPPA